MSVGTNNDPTTPMSGGDDSPPTEEDGEDSSVQQRQPAVDDSPPQDDMQQQQPPSFLINLFDNHVLFHLVLTSNSRQYCSQAVARGSRQATNIHEQVESSQPVLIKCTEMLPIQTFHLMGPL